MGEIDDWDELEDSGDIKNESEKAKNEEVDKINSKEVEKPVIGTIVEKDGKKEILSNSKVVDTINKKDSTTIARRPPIGDNIKILLYGGAGTGKTRTAVLYFKKLWEKDKNIRCKFFDTDKGLTEVLEEEDSKGNRIFSDKLVDNIDWYDCKDFNVTLQAMKEVFDNTTKDDIVIFDMVDKLYEDSQAKYTEDVFGEDLAKYVVYKRQELSRSKGTRMKGAFEGWTDWVAIKLLHNREVIDKITKEIGCHVICITSAKEVETHDPTEGKIVKNPDIFTRIGFAPVGERRNPHRFDRIYFFTVGSEGWYYMAAKKRGGEVYKKISIRQRDHPIL